jgi:hypothetical protein
MAMFMFLWEKTVVNGVCLSAGKTKSCGCLRVYLSRNRQSNRLISHNGKTQCLTAWAEEYGIHKVTFWHRLKLGWSMEKALTTPIGKYKRK